MRQRIGTLWNPDNRATDDGEGRARNGWPAIWCVVAHLAALGCQAPPDAGTEVPAEPFALGVDLPWVVSEGHQRAPSVAPLDGGPFDTRYLVAWLDERSDGCRIMASVVTNDGELSQTPLALDGAPCSEPQVAGGGGGAIAWASSLTGRVHVVLNPLSDSRIEIDAPTTDFRDGPVGIGFSPTHVAVAWSELDRVAWFVVDRDGRMSSVSSVAAPPQSTALSIRIASDGTRFAMLLGEGYLASRPRVVTFDDSGALLSVTEQLTGPMAGAGALVWSGAELVAVIDLSPPVLLPLGPDGSSPGSPIELAIEGTLESAAASFGRLEVVWSRFALDPFRQTLTHRTFNFDGIPALGTEEQILTLPGSHASWLSSDGQLLAFEHPSTAGGLDVATQRLGGSGPFRITPGWNSQRAPRIASNGSVYLAVWSEGRGTDTDGDLYGMRLSASGHPLDQAPWPVALRPGAQRSTALLSNGRDFVVLFQEGDPLDPNGRLWGVPVSSEGSPSAATDLGTFDDGLVPRPGGWTKTRLDAEGIHLLPLSSQLLPSTSERTYAHPSAEERCTRIHAWPTKVGTLLACQYQRRDPARGSVGALRLSVIDDAGVATPWGPEVEFTGKLAWHGELGLAVDLAAARTFTFDAAAAIVATTALSDDIPTNPCAHQLLATSRDATPFLLWWSEPGDEPQGCTQVRAAGLDADGNLRTSVIELADLEAPTGNELPLADAIGHVLFARTAFDDSVRATRALAQFVFALE